MSVHRPDLDEERLTGERCLILEILNTPAEPKMSLARARVPPGVCTALHRLDGVTERYYMLEGRGAVRIGSGPETEVEGGDCVTIPPGVAQQIRNTGPKDLVFLCICTPRFVPACYVDLE